MTELAFMVRGDWAQRGTAMSTSGAAIRTWLDDVPFFAVTEPRTVRGVDREVADSIESNRALQQFFPMRELASTRESIEIPVVVVQPVNTDEIELLREACANDAFDRMFVLLWARTGAARSVMDAYGAIDLHTGVRAEPSEPLVIEAARDMVQCEYNGLSSGRGKDVVVQLVRAFAAAGHNIAPSEWARAYFAAGGRVEPGATVERLASEAARGVRHRTSPALRDDIVEILAERVPSKR